MQETFDYNDRLWGASTESTSFFSWGRAKLIFFKKHIETVSGALIDIGCGAGQFTRAFAKAYPNRIIYGVDGSNKSISYARKCGPKSINYKVGDVTDLEYENGEFKIAVACDVLEHIKDADACVSEISRIIKKGGLFISATPLEGSLWTIHGLLSKLFLYKSKEEQIGHVQRFTKNEYVALLERHGFEIVSLRYSGFFFTQLFDILLSFIRIYRGKTYSVTKEISHTKGITSMFLRFLNTFAVGVSNFENAFFSNFPGHTILVCAKKVN